MKYVVTLNGKNYEVEVTETEAVLLGASEAQTVTAAPAAPATPAAPAAPAESSPVKDASPVAEGNTIKAPMPGTILAVNAAVGAAVKKGDVLFVLEAMKMENDITSPMDGTVKQVRVQKGDSVETDNVLCVL